MQFQTAAFLAALPTLASAALLNVELAAVIVVLAVLASTGLTVLRSFKVPPVNIAVDGVISFIRGTPLLIQIFLAYYVLPALGLNLSPIMAGILAISCNSAIFLAETMRAGLGTIDPGQVEAATALGLHPAFIWLRVVAAAVPAHHSRAGQRADHRSQGYSAAVRDHRGGGPAHRATDRQCDVSTIREPAGGSTRLPGAEHRHRGGRTADRGAALGRARLMRFEPAILAQYAPLFLQGAWLTVQITVCASLLGYALAVGVALLGLLRGWLPRLLVSAYVGALRSVPFIIILFVIYYGLPFAGLRLPALLVGTVALGLLASAYYAEVIRAAILAIPAGQFDSARAVGITYTQAMRNVIAPQVLRALVPPSTSTTLSMMKESAMLSSITVPELTYQGLVVQGETFAPFEVFAAVTLLYWAIAIVISGLARRAELRFGQVQAQAVQRSAIAAKYLSLDWRGRA